MVLLPPFSCSEPLLDPRPSGTGLGWAGALRSARGCWFFGALEIYWDRNLIDHLHKSQKNPRILLGHYI